MTDQQLDLWTTTGETGAIAHTIALPDADLVFYPTLLEPAEHEELFHRLYRSIPWHQDRIVMYGQSRPVPRLTAWYGDRGTSYTYSGITLHPRPWLPVLLALKARLEDISAARFNSVLLNLYRDGRDSVAWHSDDEPELGPCPVIGSLSLGSPRRFVLRHKSQRLTHALDLPPGSYLLMQGQTQHHWLHQVPKTTRSVTPRINLTFRWITPLPLSPSQDGSPD